jgi:hypothetical protein
MTKAKTSKQSKQRKGATLKASSEPQRMFATPSRESDRERHEELQVESTSQIYSTPQTYFSGVISCGSGSIDWGTSIATDSLRLSQFSEVIKRHPVVASFGSPFKRGSSITCSSLDSSSSDSSSSSSAENESIFGCASKRTKRETSIGFNSSPESRFSSCSPSPPFLFHKNSFQMKCSIIDDFDDAATLVAAPKISPSLSSSPPITEKKISSPFYDILHESPSLSSSADQRVVAAQEVAQYFFRSLSALYPHLFPSVDLFDTLALQYVSLSSSTTAASSSSVEF